MTTTTDLLAADDQPIETRPTLALEAQTHAEVDVQITTARRFPRSVRTFIDEALAMATLDEDTAAACIYALPRDGKSIEGPSARLAEICASAWGHLRVQARVVDEDDRFVTGRGEAWDIQRNVAIAFEVRRRVTGKSGKKYTDDMVAMTGSAVSSIALRNAIFKVIPMAFWRPIYQQCREVAVGKAETLASKRAAMLAYFQKMGVTEDRIFARLGLRGVEDIGLDQLAVLRGTATSIKDGETTVDDAFPATPAAVLTMPQRASAAAAPAPAATAPAPAPAPAPAATEGGWLTDRILNAGPSGTGWASFTESGLRLWTRDRALGDKLLAAAATHTPITFTADPVDPHGRRKLTAIEG